MLTRHKALKPGKPLAKGKEPSRRKPLRSSALKTVTTLKRSAPKHAAPAGQPFPPAVAAVIDERDACCQRCGSTRGLHRHHRRGKASGGSRNRAHTQCACNGILLCWLCHHWAHVTGRRQAGAEGFVVSQSEDEPGSVSVMRFAAAGSGAAQYPTCDGQWSSAPGERAA